LSLSLQLQAKDWLSSYWSGYNSPSQMSRIRNTGMPLEVLKEVR
jgi:2-oxoglutarate dehydrogenase E1 component